MKNILTKFNRYIALNKTLNSIDDKIKEIMSNYSDIFLAAMYRDVGYRALPVSMKKKPSQEIIYAIKYDISLFTKRKGRFGFKEKIPFISFYTTFYVFNNGDRFNFQSVPEFGFQKASSETIIDLTDTLLMEFDKL